MKKLGHAIALLIAGNAVPHARCWHHACFRLARGNQVDQCDQLEESWIFRKREALIQGFGRAKSLLDAALDWREPRIRRGEDDVLAAVRGAFGGM